MGESKSSMVRLTPTAHAYLRESARLVGLLDPDPDDRTLLTIQGCAEFAALLLFRNLVRQVEAAGQLGTVRPELLASSGHAAAVEPATTES